MTVRISTATGADGSAANVVRHARKAAGLSQKKLAARLGTSQSVVSRWERGHDEPRLSSLRAIARACGFRLALELHADDVDRAQIRQQLALDPEERLANVVNLSRVLATAQVVE
ncbi:MAG: helix-turn-helix transcriptional regulator [Acidimicrobiia bacterium]|nr:helix-turn-helix transcriptional regulator [Acidimicrobiia bacterium]